MIELIKNIELKSDLDMKNFKTREFSHIKLSELPELFLIRSSGKLPSIYIDDQIDPKRFYLAMVENKLSDLEVLSFQINLELKHKYEWVLFKYGNIYILFEDRECFEMGTMNMHAAFTMDNKTTFESLHQSH